jgi:hypothetical protein
LGIGATVAGLEEFVRERFRGVIVAEEEAVVVLVVVVVDLCCDGPPVLWLIKLIWGGADVHVKPMKIWDD